MARRIRARTERRYRRSPNKLQNSNRNLQGSIKIQSAGRSSLLAKKFQKLRSLEQADPMRTALGGLILEVFLNFEVCEFEISAQQTLRESRGQSGPDIDCPFSL